MGSLLGLLVFRLILGRGWSLCWRFLETRIRRRVPLRASAAPGTMCALCRSLSFQFACDAACSVIKRAYKGRLQQAVLAKAVVAFRACIVIYIMQAVCFAHATFGIAHESGTEKFVILIGAILPPYVRCASRHSGCTGFFLCMNRTFWRRRRCPRSSVTIDFKREERI